MLFIQYEMKKCPQIGIYFTKSQLKVILRNFSTRSLKKFQNPQKILRRASRTIHLEYKDVVRRGLIRNVVLVTVYLKFKIASQILPVQAWISRDSIDFGFKG